MQLYRLDRMVRTLLDEKRLHEQVGAGWRLFFYVCLNLNKEKEFTTTYQNIAKSLGLSLSTLKSWRRHLVDGNVLRSFSGGNVVHFKLLEPYRSMLVEGEENTVVTSLVPEIVQVVEERLRKIQQRKA
jgi:hypothetical protein